MQFKLRKSQTYIFLATLVLSGALSPRLVLAQESQLTIEPIFIDTEHRYGVGTGWVENPGMVTDVYFEQGIFNHFTSYLGGINNGIFRPAGEIYVYRFEGAEMGGAAMGYNHVGNGAFFHPTIPLPASTTKAPELTWMTDGARQSDNVDLESVPYIADRGDIPSMALGQGLTRILLQNYAGGIGVEYLPGNTLGSGGNYYRFGQGAVSYAMAAFWGAPPTDSQPFYAYFGNVQVEGPSVVSLGMDGYTTTSLSLTFQRQHEYSYRNLFVAETGKSASQYLQEIGYEPSPPPVWVKKMALEEKLTGKTKWLYPPLTRHADANGDGIYDAADLAAVYMAAKKE